MTDPEPGPFANRHVIVWCGGARLFDKHLASTIHCVDDEIMGWLHGVSNAGAPALCCLMAIREATSLSLAVGV